MNHKNEHMATNDMNQNRPRPDAQERENASKNDDKKNKNNGRTEHGDRSSGGTHR